MADNFFITYGVRVWVKAATLATVPPTSNAGMIELINLIDQPFNLSTDSVDIITQGSSGGFTKPIISRSSWAIPLEMNLDVTSPGYLALKFAAMNAANSAVNNALQFWMETPVVDGSAAAPEAHAGICQVADFQPTLKAGDVAQIRCTLQGFGDPTWTGQGNTTTVGRIATLTIVSGGVGLTAGTAVPLVAAGAGAGYGATATVAVTGGVISTATIVSPGRGFVVGNLLTIISPTVVGPGDTLPTLSVATLVP
jgi:hypothetical protein